MALKKERNPFEFIPAAPGAYLLELSLDAQTEIRTGRFAGLLLQPAVYLYSGSACSPGGLRGRLARHIRPVEEVRLHWHIDTLRQVARLHTIAWIPLAEARFFDIECRWAQTLQDMPGATIPIPGFGSSDCRCGCRAHLVAFDYDPADSTPRLDSQAWRSQLCAAVDASDQAFQSKVIPAFGG